MFAVLVAPPVAPVDGCPSARQVTEALQARLASYLFWGDDAAAIVKSDVLRAVLDVAPDGTVVRFSLVDARGDTQLRRVLPAPGRGTSLTDCVALADTVAAIVERYLGEIEYAEADAGQTVEVPGPSRTPGAVTAATASTRPVPGRAGLAIVGVGWRMAAGGEGASNQNGLEAKLAAQMELNRSFPRVAVLLSLGLSESMEFDPSNPPLHLSLRRFPVRIGGLLEVPVGRGWLEPCLQAGTDVLALSTTQRGLATSYAYTRFTPVAEAAVGYRVRVANRFSVRPTATLGLVLKSYDIQQPVGNPPLYSSVLVTPRAYASFGIDFAMVFR